jgi:Frataxin-like domain
MTNASKAVMIGVPTTMTTRQRALLLPLRGSIAKNTIVAADLAASRHRWTPIQEFASQSSSPVRMVLNRCDSTMKKNAPRTRTLMYLSIRPSQSGAAKARPPQQLQYIRRVRGFQTEAEFHPVADQTLETIQDAVDGLLDQQTSIEYEVSCESGVLTMKLPPHGTWVLNKQTPNRQIWVRNVVLFYFSLIACQLCFHGFIAFTICDHHFCLVLSFQMRPWLWIVSCCC